MKQQGSVRKVQLISATDQRAIKRDVIKLLNERPEALVGDLQHVVSEVLTKRSAILKISKAHPTPFYLIDDAALRQGIKRFAKAFTAKIPGIQIFYAMKLNHHPYIIKQVLRGGLNLDVSSHRELSIALHAGARKIVFTGPAKSVPGLQLAVHHSDKVTINMDSFQELANLGAVTKQMKKSVRAGVRVFTGAYTKWNKFGIPLRDLKAFWQRAKRQPNIKLQGIHMHISWNRDAKPYADALRQIAAYLKKEFTKQEISQIKFIDFGGGYRPHRAEGYYPSTTDQGEIINIVSHHYGAKVKYQQRYLMVRSLEIEQYATGIAQAIDRYLRPLGDFEYYTEPGRIICNNAMHIVTRIADIKPQQVIIADGGNNMVSWERFEYYYFPLINLTHPSATKEVPALIYGNLCLLEDVWGYYCYAQKLAVGDVLVVPYQGALTYSLAQNFIHPIPETYILR